MVPDEQTVRAVMDRARRAPSLHNSQPWQWHWDGTTAALHVLPDRTLPAIDAFNRQGMVACGVMLHHAATAFAAAGWPPSISRFPEPTVRAHLASLTFGEPRPPTEGEASLGAAIDRRYTDRAPLQPFDRWPDLLPVLHAACQDFGATLSVPGADVRAELGHLSWTTAALRRRDPKYQAEERWWLAGGAPDSGIPSAALPPAHDADRVPINRVFRGGTAGTGSARHDDCHLMLIATTGDGAESLLSCGEALSAVLLECTRLDVGTCVLTHLTELPATRTQVTALTGARFPQVFVRAGRARVPSPPRTPRRPVESVLRLQG